LAVVIRVFTQPADKADIRTKNYITVFCCLNPSTSTSSIRRPRAQAV